MWKTSQENILSVHTIFSSCHQFYIMHVLHGLKFICADEPCPCPVFGHSLWVRVENGALLLAAEPLDAVLEPAVPSCDRFSSGGNWKGRDTGTRPPSIPNPRGRDEAELSRPPLPVVET